MTPSGATNLKLNYYLIQNVHRARAVQDFIHSFIPFSTKFSNFKREKDSRRFNTLDGWGGRYSVKFYILKDDSLDSHAWACIGMHRLVSLSSCQIGQLGQLVRVS